MPHQPQGTGAADPRPRLLIAVRELPAHPRSGSPLRTHRLAAGLSETFAVTLLTYAHDERSGAVPATQAELAAALPGIEVVTVPGLKLPKRARQLVALPGRRSWEWGRFRTRAMAQALRETVARTQAQLVHWDDVGVALNGYLPGPVNAFAPHNVEHAIIAATASSATGIRKGFASVDARRVEREEAGLWRGADLCVAVSELEAQTMRAGGARDVIVAPNGTDPVDPLPRPVRAPGEPLRVLFVGAGDYWPNGHGLAWMVREVLPLVRARTPVQFDVVGSPPIEPVETEGVTYHGRVPELREWYERAHVVVAPLFLGSGTRLKVVEALAYARPLVSTTVGAEGATVHAGEHYVRADEPAAFADALVEVGQQVEAGDPRLDAMVAAGRAAVEPLFWPRIAAGLAEAYAAAIATRAGR